MGGIRTAVDRWLSYALMLLMAASVINVLWQVFTRFILQDPSSYTEELARFLLIWIGLLGASYASGKGMHLAIDYFAHKFSLAMQKTIGLIIQFMVSLFAMSIMVIGGIRLVYITLVLDQTSAALQIKLGYVYLVLPLSGIIIIFYAVAAFLDLMQTDEESVTEAGG
ncbi:TRAP transporter small permease [Candidatus Neomarinimicrobiota bacterium]